MQSVGARVRKGLGVIFSGGRNFGFYFHIQMTLDSTQCVCQVGSEAVFLELGSGQTLPCSSRFGICIVAKLLPL